MEVTRRILLVLGLAGGFLAWFTARPIVVAVGVEDFVADKVAAEDRPTGFMHRDDTLEEFHRYRTEDRILRVEGREWREFHETVRAAVVEGRGDEKTLSRRGSGYRDDDLFYLVDDPRIAEAYDAFAARPPLLYVGLAAVGEEPGPHSPTLTLLRLDPSDSAGDAPDWILLPFGFLAPWLLGGGLAAYLLLPRRRHREGAIHYGGMQAVVMPDLVATMLLVTFLALPLGVMKENGVSLLDLGGTGWILLLVFWLFLIAPLTILVITAKNASFSAEFTDDSIRLCRWNGKTTLRFDEIDSLRVVSWRTPRWLRAIAWLGVLVSWRGIVPAATLEQGRGAGIEVVRKDGPAVRVWIAGLGGWERFVSALETGGVIVEEEVWELYGVRT
jgi:hypothetical protein